MDITDEIAALAKKYEHGNRQEKQLAAILLSACGSAKMGPAELDELSDYCRQMSLYNIAVATDRIRKMEAEP